MELLNLFQNEKEAIGRKRKHSGREKAKLIYNGNYGTENNPKMEHWC